MRSTSFDRFAGWCGLLAGIGAFLYAYAFVILQRSNPGLAVPLFSTLLLLNGLLAVVAFTALYNRVRGVDAGFALLALLFALAGQLGAAVHGGYDLANAINPPGALDPAVQALPNPVDPRGLLTFGLTALGLFLFGGLVLQSRTLPRSLGYLGHLLGILLLVIYVARLTVLSPANPLLLGPVLVSGFVVSPLFYLWLGRTLGRQGGPEVVDDRGGRVAQPAH
jgi:hypothetical protein